MKTPATPCISVVSPVYGSASLIPRLCERLHEVLQNLKQSYEIILVFDCSPDEGWQKIQEECQKSPFVKGLLLSRNFGQHYAITAGLAHASGEWIVVMDCDLQDRPEAIAELFQACQSGFDVVQAQRGNRKDKFLKRLSSKIFYWIFSFMTDSQQDASVGNFGIYHRKVIQAILSMQDKVRYFPTMVQWVGFKQTKVTVEHANRAEGKSGYSLFRLLSLTMNNMLAFSEKPLRITVMLGMLICLMSLLIAVYFLLRFFLGGIEVSGFTSLILSIWLSTGMMIFILGILGIYLGRCFNQVKNRPSFIIKKKENFNED